MMGLRVINIAKTVYEFMISDDQRTKCEMKRLFDGPVQRAIYLMLGIVFFAAGVIGVFLPVLPTTPFMLLALWAFSNSSQRLHDYIWHHKRYGPLVRAWKKYGAVPLRAKVSALIVMALSAIFVVFFSGAPYWAILSALALMLVGATYLVTRPTLQESDCNEL